MVSAEIEIAARLAYIVLVLAAALGSYSLKRACLIVCTLSGLPVLSGFPPGNLLIAGLVLAASELPLLGWLGRRRAVFWFAVIVSISLESLGPERALSTVLPLFVGAQILWFDTEDGVYDRSAATVAGSILLAANIIAGDAAYYEASSTGIVEVQRAVIGSADPNAIAMTYLALLALVLRRGPSQSAVGFLGILPISAGIVLTGSRTAIVGLGIVGALTILAPRRMGVGAGSGPSRVALRVAGLGAFVGAVRLAYSLNIVARFARFSQAGELRAELYRAAGGRILESPERIFFGGLAQGSHNSLVEIVLSIGIVGLVCLGGLFLSFPDRSGEWSRASGVAGAAVLVQASTIGAASEYPFVLIMFVFGSAVRKASMSRAPVFNQANSQDSGVSRPGIGARSLNRGGR